MRHLGLKDDSPNDSPHDGTRTMVVSYVGSVPDSLLRYFVHLFYALEDPEPSGVLSM